MRYVAIFFSSWMDEGRFNVEPIESESVLEAQIKAESIAYNRSSTFKSCHAHVVAIRNNERVIARRKLTLIERLTGYTDVTKDCL